jgi:signal transduction histidine kinase
MQNLISFTSLMASGILFLLGVFVLLQGTNKVLNRSFFVYFLALSVWSLGVYGLVSGFSTTILIWLKIMEAGVVFMPSTFLLFTYNFLNKEYRPKHSLVSVSFALSTVYLCLSFTPFFFMGVTKVKFGYVGQPYLSPIFPVFVAFVVLSMAYGLYCLYHELVRSKGSRLQQLLYFFFASALFWVSALSVVPTLIGKVIIGGFPIWNFTNILYGLILSYAIIRHRLMDIEVVVKRGVVYSALAAAIAGAYSAFVLIFGQIFDNRSRSAEWLVIAATSITIAVGFIPLQELLIHLTDRYFFRKQYNYRTALKDLGKDIAEIMPLRPFLYLFTKKLMEIMRLSGACFAVWSEKERSFVFLSSRGGVKCMEGKQLEENDAVISALKGKEYLTNIEASSELKSWMETFKIQLMIPCSIKGRTKGIIFLGEKLSQDEYTDEDLELLTTLAPQLGMSISNCQTYGEERELREAAEEKMEEAKAKAERSNRLAALGTITANLAHEIKNPMTVLRSRAERGLNKVGDQEFVRETFNLLITHIDGILKIVGNMLKFAKTKEWGKLSPLDVNKVMEETLSLSISRMKDKNIELIKDLKADKMVNGDATSLQEAFLNIIMNAIVFTDEGGKLTVITKDSGDNIEVSIKDTGIGMNKEVLSHLFEPFFTTRAEGTGLGLSITYRIVNDHGGHIDVSSKPEQGSNFTIVLPAVHPTSSHTT